MQTKPFVARLSALAAAAAVAAGTLGAGAPSASAAGSNNLNVKAGEYTYKVSGAPKAGWTQINFDNKGVEYHMLGMAQLKKNVTLKQLKAAVNTEDESDENKLVVGGVNPLPGVLGPSEATAILTKLKAGRYGIFCYIPAPDGKPHALHGMVDIFDVSSAKSSLTPPKDGVIPVTLSDNGITLPSAGLPKSGWVKVTNSTSVSRSLGLGRYLTPTATFEQADAYFNTLFSGSGEAGDPPASIMGGLEGIPAGGAAYLQLNLDPGRYVVVSQNGDVDNDPNQFHTDFEIK
jgi:hypothetical protein